MTERPYFWMTVRFKKPLTELQIAQLIGVEGAIGGGGYSVGAHQPEADAKEFSFLGTESQMKRIWWALLIVPEGNRAVTFDVTDAN